MSTDVFPQGQMITPKRGRIERIVHLVLLFDAAAGVVRVTYTQHELLVPRWVVVVALVVATVVLAYAWLCWREIRVWLRLMPLRQRSYPAPESAALIAALLPGRDVGSLTGYRVMFQKATATGVDGRSWLIEAGPWVELGPKLYKRDKYALVA